MKRLIFCVLLGLLATFKAEAGVFNEWEGVKGLVTSLQPKIGTFRDLNEPDWETLYSGSLFDFTTNDFKLGSIDIGYSPRNKALAVVYLNLEGLKAFNIELPLGGIQPQVGFGGGWDFENETGVYGFALIGWQF